ncbi:MAG: response regulator [Elusimicrobia bacterium]|nr:response regulator [Elusimicrobiota bacterium]
MNARVLAVEDTPSLRALLELSLTRAGYQVSLAEDGQAALDLYISGGHDAVIMDIQMPVMDGLTAAQAMRAWEKRGGRKPAPILALTANSEPADLKRCLDAGFTATVRKPFAREELLAALARELEASPAPVDGELVRADPEFADLIPRFLDNSRAEAESMRAALTRRDYASVAASSHKLIGAGASFGFRPLSDTSLLIEAAAKESDGARALEHLETLSAYLARVKVVYS